MSLRVNFQKTLEELQTHYLKLRQKNETLERELVDAEIAESVYNSNAIENSTLNLSETEDILFDEVIHAKTNLREVFEAKNLARVLNLGPIQNVNTLLQAHGVLLSHISDELAGRFRKKGEHVRIANHVAPVSEKVPALIDELFLYYATKTANHIVEKIAKFHLEFERIHPFGDGNGRIGRVLINSQLIENDYPPIILRFSDKKKYFSAFKDYNAREKTGTMEKLIVLALIESLHKRIAHYQGEKIIPLAEWVRTHHASPSATYNAAKAQRIPAFRVRETWMIAKSWR